jgi:hypothetical protein
MMSALYSAAHQELCSTRPAGAQLNEAMVRKKRSQRRAKGKRVRTKKGFKDRGLELGILFLALILILFFYSIVYQRWLSPAPEKPLPVEHKVVRVEVLNGCGAAGLAKKVTDFLRLQGFDVVNVGNAENFEFPETIVVDRVGDVASAWRVARVLGVDNVIQQKDEDLILEVSLILGRDYQDLEPLQEVLGGE